MNQLQSHPARPSRHRLCALATVALLGLLPMAAWHTAAQAANPAANPATTSATTSATTPATTAAEFNAAFELYQRAFASTFLGLPAMFNRQARGAKLLDELLRQPLLEGAPLPFRGVVWMTAANNAIKSQRNDEARQWLQKIVASAAPQAAVAQAKLKAL